MLLASSLGSRLRLTQYSRASSRDTSHSGRTSLSPSPLHSPSSPEGNGETGSSPRSPARQRREGCAATPSPPHHRACGRSAQTLPEFTRGIGQKGVAGLTRRLFERATETHSIRDTSREPTVHANRERAACAATKRHLHEDASPSACGRDALHAEPRPSKRGAPHAAGRENPPTDTATMTAQSDS
jgi:hypothetical protein